mmetsp:Transcript_156270/g.501391  ORF Transcript_156270/g.501391 Transcript_156270/m.501391 type:complete len:247 (+) Transcript_156270:2418-3158(+)
MFLPPLLVFPLLPIGWTPVQLLGPPQIRCPIVRLLHGGSGVWVSRECSVCALVLPRRLRNVGARRPPTARLLKPRVLGLAHTPRPSHVLRGPERRQRVPPHIPAHPGRHLRRWRRIPGGANAAGAGDRAGQEAAGGNIRRPSCRRQGLPPRSPGALGAAPGRERRGRLCRREGPRRGGRGGGSRRWRHLKCLHWLTPRAPPLPQRRGRRRRHRRRLHHGQLRHLRRPTLPRAALRRPAPASGPCTA